MKRIALGIQYDGSPWNGWQTQPDGKTVQDALESALQKFTQQKIRTICAGRTDAGVHAVEQVVHFDTDAQRESSSWVRGLNAFLPHSVAVRWACEVAGDIDLEIEPANALSPALTDLPGSERMGFHARYSAIARTYQYLIYNHPVRSPLWRGRAGWVFRPLNETRMQQASQHLLGRHDFSAFRAVECQAKSPVREMQQIQVMRSGSIIVVTLRANAFLHHMVRNIIGSLIYVGNGSQEPDWMAHLLATQDRRQAAPTFSSDGLYLARVDYDPKWTLPQEATTSSPFPI